MKDRYFRTVDIENLLGIPQNRFKGWLWHGYIKPTVKASTRGQKHLFTKEDLYRIYIFEKLMKASYSLTRERTAREIEKMDLNPGGRSTILKIEIDYDEIKRTVDQLIEL
jgi:hypothetical protein